MVSYEKMEAFEEAVQVALDTAFQRRRLIAIHAYRSKRVRKQEVVVVYKAEDVAEEESDKRIFSIHYREWDREFDTDKADLGPIIARRLKPETEKVELYPIEVDGTVIGYGVGPKNSKRISYAVHHLKGFFSDDLCEPNVLLLAEIEVEIPKQ